MDGKIKGEKWVAKLEEKIHACVAPHKFVWLFHDLMPLPGVSHGPLPSTCILYITNISPTFFTN
jgi:hypothetical protein